jgi:phosphomannomutase
MIRSEVSQIFRSYDIRGIVGQDLNEEIMEHIGLAFGTCIKKDAVIAHDVRIHSQDMKDAFVRGFLSSGHSIEDCGLLSLGAGMFHAWKSKRDFAFITASHLTREWNGVKFFHGSGAGFIEKENMNVRDKFLLNKDAKIPRQKDAQVKTQSNGPLVEKYVNFLASKVKIGKKIDVALDCGNGCACLFAPRLFKKVGCNVEVLFGDIDGTFPNHLPDPLEKEIFLLKQIVVGHDIGIAYDGDADRTALVDDKGGFMTPEETSFVILTELLKKEKGDIVANVECTRIIDVIASRFERKVIRVPVGHTFLMNAVHTHKAAFGVESAGHYALPYFVPFDDAMVIGLYVANVLSKRAEKLSELRKDIPNAFFERLSYKCPDDVKFDIIKSLSNKLAKDFENINTMDGVRIDFDNGWALLRISNTSPVIRLTIEGITEQDKKNLQKTFIEYLRSEMASYGLGLVSEH